MSPKRKREVVDRQEEEKEKKKKSSSSSNKLCTDSSIATSKPNKPATSFKIHLAYGGVEVHDVEAGTKYVYISTSGGATSVTESKTVKFVSEKICSELRFKMDILPAVVEALRTLQFPVEFDDAIMTIMQQTSQVGPLPGGLSRQTFRLLGSINQETFRIHDGTTDVSLAVVKKDLHTLNQIKSSGGGGDKGGGGGGSGGKGIGKDEKDNSDTKPLKVNLRVGGHFFNKTWFTHRNGPGAVTTDINQVFMHLPITHADLLQAAQDALRRSTMRMAFDPELHLLMFETAEIRRASSDKHPKMWKVLHEVSPSFSLPDDFSEKELNVVVVDRSTAAAPAAFTGGEQSTGTDSVSFGVTKWSSAQLMSLKTKNTFPISGLEFDAFVPLDDNARLVVLKNLGKWAYEKAPASDHKLSVTEVLRAIDNVFADLPRNAETARILPAGVKVVNISAPAASSAGIAPVPPPVQGCAVKLGEPYVFARAHGEQSSDTMVMSLSALRNLASVGRTRNVDIKLPKESGTKRRFEAGRWFQLLSVDDEHEKPSNNRSFLLQPLNEDGHDDDGTVRKSFDAFLVREEDTDIDD